MRIVRPNVFERRFRFVGALLCIAAFACPSLAHDSQNQAEARQLAEAEALLYEREEPPRRKGAEICLRLNSLASMKLMLRILNEQNPHTRDIVWDVLPRFRDLYARKHVELELRKNRQNAEVREWCAELLGLWDDASFGDTLKKALGDKEIGVRRAAARSLGRLRYEPATGALAQAARQKDPHLRANVIEALARIDLEKHLATFEKGLADKDPGVRCAVLGAAGALYPDRVEEWSAAALDEEDWRPRMQAVDNLAAIKTKTSVDALIRATGDGRPVVSHRANRSLQQMTRKKWTMQKQWELWWTENRELYDFPSGRHRFAPAKDDRYATYNEIQIVSDHVAFLIDKSKQMQESLKNGTTKDRAALVEFEAALRRLSGDFVFNVFTYSREAEPFARKPIRLSDKSRRATVEFVAGKPTAGYKDIWHVLGTIVPDPSLDTIYPLSSGEPEVGLYVHWNRVVAHLAELNRFHKVVIHCVSYSDNKWYRTQLEKIAQATGGDFSYQE